MGGAQEKLVLLAGASGLVGAGARRFVVIPSVGADPGARSFYLRTKGEVEEQLEEAGSEPLDVLQPSLLLGRRAEMRPLELAARAFMLLVNALLRGKYLAYHAVSARTVGTAMLGATRSGRRGVQRYTYAGIAALARLGASRTQAAAQPRASARARQAGMVRVDRGPARRDRGAHRAACGRVQEPAGDSAGRPIAERRPDRRARGILRRHPVRVRWRGRCGLRLQRAGALRSRARGARHSAHCGRAAARRRSRAARGAFPGRPGIFSHPSACHRSRRGVHRRRALRARAARGPDDRVRRYEQRLLRAAPRERRALLG